MRQHRRSRSGFHLPYFCPRGLGRVTVRSASRFSVERCSSVVQCVVTKQTLIVSTESPLPTTTASMRSMCKPPACRILTKARRSTLESDGSGSGCVCQYPTKCRPRRAGLLCRQGTASDRRRKNIGSDGRLALGRRPLLYRPRHCRSRHSVQTAVLLPRDARIVADGIGTSARCTTRVYERVASRRDY